MVWNGITQNQSEEYKTNLMSLAILFPFLCTQHISDINISITTKHLTFIDVILRSFSGMELLLFILKTAHV
jgi:hypothetical protein